MADDPKTILRRYFDLAHDALLWKLDGLSEYDQRRPLTPTGTSLLGLVKHVAVVELGYFGEVFDRPHGVPIPATAEELHGDMFARADETAEYIRDLFASARAHAAATIDELDLDAEGHVPWWGENNPVTLQQIVLHMTTEVHRHAGQADILREQLDGAAGLFVGNDNMPPQEQVEWAAYCDRLETIADGFRRPSES